MEMQSIPYYHFSTASLSSLSATLIILKNTCTWNGVVGRQQKRDDCVMKLKLKVVKE